MLAHSPTEQPASNSRVTAAPRRSWKCSPVTPAARAVLIQTLRNAPVVHGRPRGPVKMIGPRRGALSSTRRRGESLPVGLLAGRLGRTFFERHRQPFQLEYETRVRQAMTGPTRLSGGGYDPDAHPTMN